MEWLTNLSKLKKLSGMTTEDISKASGISKGTLNKIFAGQTKDPQLSTIKSIVHSMGYTLDDLDDQPTAKTNTVNNVLSSFEHIHIQKYRRLNEPNKTAVDVTIDTMLIAQDADKKGMPDAKFA